MHFPVFMLRYSRLLKSGQNKFTVIVPKKALPKATARHTIKRSIYNLLDEFGIGRGNNSLMCAIILKKVDSKDNTALLAMILESVRKII